MQSHPRLQYYFPEEDVSFLQLSAVQKHRQDRKLLSRNGSADGRNKNSVPLILPMEKSQEQVHGSLYRIPAKKYVLHGHILRSFPWHPPFASPGDFFGRAPVDRKSVV